MDTRGVFAGTNLTGSSISQDEEDTRSLYGSPISLSDIFSGKAQIPGAAQAFLGAVEKYAGRTKAQD